jgi:two-component system OmpR family sensor kinase
VPLLILIPILLLVVNDLLRRLLAPINELSQAVNHRDNDDTSALPLLLLPTEVQPVVLATNRLLSRLGESMQAQRRFIADAAHELRTPMTALSLQAQRLEAIALPADARVRLQALLTGITRTRHLLDQLLNLARIQNAMPARANKSASAAPLTTPVKASFARVLENTLNGARTKQIDLGVSDAPADEVNVRANEDNLDSIVRNLVDNAIRYTPIGGQIDVSLRIEHAHAIISVQDSGPGIEPSERLRVLDPFYRVLGTEQLGTGLGLAIVSTLLQQLNGSLVLTDREDGGTGLLAQVRLPLAH